MKSTRFWNGIGFLMMALLLLPVCAAAYDVPIKFSQDGTAVPDVEQLVPDNSCWLAAAANVLGAAGWGTGADAQTKADNIYKTQLLPHFSNGVRPGWSSLAINWWLMNYGCNPDKADYNATIDYTDVTYISGVARPGVYDLVLSELRDCQYVNVGLQPLTGIVGHEMTLVGGDWSGKAGSQSVWHDNCGDFLPGTDDEAAINTFTPEGAWTSILHRNNIMYTPEDATLLCPGLRKPDAAVKNFDAAYFKDMDANGSLVNGWRVAGENKGNYHGNSGSTYPEWLNDFEVEIPNLQMPEPWYKEVYLLVDYIDRDDANLANIQLNVGGQLILPDRVDWADDGGQALFVWILDELDGQPPSESLVFPDLSYRQLFDISTGLGGPVKDWNVATICVPEPATLSLLIVGVVVLLCLRRKA